MKWAFVDTLYFVALFNPRDQWHERAVAANKLITDTKLITTEALHKSGSYNYLILLCDLCVPLCSLR